MRPPRYTPDNSREFWLYQEKLERQTQELVRRSHIWRSRIEAIGAFSRGPFRRLIVFTCCASFLFKPSVKNAIIAFLSYPVSLPLSWLLILAMLSMLLPLSLSQPKSPAAYSFFNFLAIIVAPALMTLAIIGLLVYLIVGL